LQNISGISVSPFASLQKDISFDNLSVL